MARRSLALLASVLAVVSLAACLSKRALIPMSYTIDPPPGPAPASAVGARVLALTRVDVSPPYAGPAFVYRTGDHGLERDPYASFAVSPGWMLTSAVRGYLRDAPFVRDVVWPGDGVPSAATIEARASELYAELGSPPVAVLTIQFRVLSPPSASAAVRELLLKTYTERVPLPARTAEAAAAAWNKALAEIMKAFLADLEPALPKVP